MKFEVSKQVDLNSNSAFRQMQGAFDRAWTRFTDQRWESNCKFAGRRARIRVVGQELAENIARVFQHLLVGGHSLSAELNIDLWDEDSTSIACPVKARPVAEQQVKTNSYIEFGLILGSLDDHLVGCQRPQMTTWFDRSGQHLIGCVAHTDKLSLYDRGKPLHFPLLLWHRDQGEEVIHAALVSKKGEGVLFVGKGGVGKSTAALACLEAGFDYLGDDYISLQACGDGSFQGHSIYSSTWFMADHLTNFPNLIPHALYPEHADQDKTLVPLSCVFSERLVASAHVRAIVLPCVTDNASARIRPASKRDALFALAPTSILLLPSSGVSALDKLAKFAETVPGYWMEVGQNLSEIPVRVQEIIEIARLRSSNC